MSNEKFKQPIDAITIVSESGRGLLLTDDVIEAAAARVAAGEDEDKVASELAMQDLLLREDWVADEDQTDGE